MKFAETVLQNKKYRTPKLSRSLQSFTVMNPEDDNNLISRFFSRELKAEERAAFEQKLSDNPSFARKFQMHRQVKEMVDQAYDDGQKEAWKTEWRDKLKAYKQRRLLMRLLVGGIGIIAIILLWRYINSSGGPSAPLNLDEVIAEAWEDSPAIHYGNERGGEYTTDNEYRSLLVESFDYYSNEDYNSAISTLEPFVEGCSIY